MSRDWGADPPAHACRWGGGWGSGCGLCFFRAGRPRGWRPRPTFRPQVSTTVETFQDLSLPIPGKEDLAKLHSAIYQNVPAKPGACGDGYTAQGWLAFIVEYIRRYPAFPPAGDMRPPRPREQHSKAKGRVLKGPGSWRLHSGWLSGAGHFFSHVGVAWVAGGPWI